MYRFSTWVITVIITGKTGAGKTSFINLVDAIACKDEYVSRLFNIIEQHESGLEDRLLNTKAPNIIIVVSVLDIISLYEPSLVASFIWSKKYNPIPHGIKYLGTLYKSFLKKFGEYSVIIVLTHMDKAPEQENFVKHVLYATEGIVSGDLFFIAKNCYCKTPCAHWSEVTLRECRKLFANLQACV